MKLGHAIALAGFVAASSPLVSFGNAFNLDTGVDASGNQLAGGAAEQRYTISGLDSQAAVVPNGPYPLNGTWVSDFAGPTGGQWISPVHNGAFDQSIGVVSYSISFNSAKVQDVTVQFTGDNAARIALNGTVLFSQAGYPNQDVHTWGYLDTYTLHLGVGVQTVRFDVSNLGGPSGLLVESSNIAVPDAGSTALMLGASLAGLGFVRRGRKGSSLPAGVA